jgi:hypothetical protein
MIAFVWTSGIDYVLAQIDGLDASIAGDLFGASFDEQRAIYQHRNAVGKREHHVHVVLDQQHADFIGYCGNGGRNFVPFVLGDPGRRLIEQEDPRAASDGERDLQ